MHERSGRQETDRPQPRPPTNPHRWAEEAFAALMAEAAGRARRRAQ